MMQEGTCYWQPQVRGVQPHARIEPLLEEAPPLAEAPDFVAALNTDS